jgi:hypothetical protein
MHAPAHTINAPQTEPVAASSQPSAGSFVTGWARSRYRLSPWAYRHARSIGVVRLVIGVFLIGVGAMLVSRGYAPVAALPFAGAVLHFVIGGLDVAAARALPHGA